MVEYGLRGVDDMLRSTEPQWADAAMFLTLSFAKAGYDIVVHHRPKAKSDIHFERAGERLFALIVNKTAGALFYIRAPAKDLQLRREICIEGGVNNERTVRINSVQDACDLLDAIGLEPVVVS